MLTSFLQFSLRQRIFVVIFTLALTAGGLYAFRAISIDAFPDVTNVLVQVVTKVEASHRPRSNVSSPFPLIPVDRGAGVDPYPFVLQSRPVDDHGRL